MGCGTVRFGYYNTKWDEDIWPKQGGVGGWGDSIRCIIRAEGLACHDTEWRISEDETRQEGETDNEKKIVEEENSLEEAIDIN